MTENGELIELSGTMAGGGKPRRGGMSSKFVEEFTDAQINEAEEALRRKKDDKVQTISDLNSLNNLYSDIHQRKIAKQREVEKAKVESMTY